MSASRPQVQVSGSQWFFKDNMPYLRGFWPQAHWLPKEKGMLDFYSPLTRFLHCKRKDLWCVLNFWYMVHIFFFLMQICCKLNKKSSADSVFQKRGESFSSEHAGKKKKRRKQTLPSNLTEERERNLDILSQIISSWWTVKCKFYVK